MNGLSSPAVEKPTWRTTASGIEEAAFAQQPQPEREVAVLVVGEERLVEPSCGEERVAAVEGRCGARREDLARVEVRLGERPSVVAAPGHAADVVGVAGAVDLARGRPRGGAGCRRTRTPGRLSAVVEEPLEPRRLREGVGVEERDPLAVVGRSDAGVVPARETGVSLEPDQLDVGEALGDPVRGAVGRGVVDDDRPVRRAGLSRERLEGPLDELASVEVDDDHGDAHSGRS